MIQELSLLICTCICKKRLADISVIRWDVSASMYGYTVSAWIAKNWMSCCKTCCIIVLEKVLQHVLL